MKNVVRIVIVDDQRPARLGLKALISLVPRIEIVGEASNGEEAIALVAEAQPDVVLMDIEMPVMDGVAATQAIKKQWPTVSVIAMTVHPKYRSAASAAGADAFFLKGATSNLLLHTIIDVVNLNRTIYANKEKISCKPKLPISADRPIFWKSAPFVS